MQINKSNAFEKGFLIYVCTDTIYLNYKFNKDIHTEFLILGEFRITKQCETIFAHDYTCNIITQFFLHYKREIA